MTLLDKKLVPRVYALIKKKGTDAIFIEEPGKEGAYDPALGKVVGVSELAHAVMVSPPYKVSKELRDASGIKEGGSSVVMPTQGITFVPKRGMRVKVPQEHPDGTVIEEVLTILALMPISTGTQIAAYEIMLGGD